MSGNSKFDYWEYFDRGLKSMKHIFIFIDRLTRGFNYLLIIMCASELKLKIKY